MLDAPLPMLLSASRLVLAPLFVASMPAGAGEAPASLAPLAIAVVAAATDFVDGRLARRTGSTSAAGAALDVAGDAAFVLCALAALARSGAVVPALPVAAAVALAAFAWSRRAGASRPPSPAAPPAPRAVADVLGHAAGVLNYGAVIAASALPLVPRAAAAVRWASVAVAIANVAPLLARAARARRTRAGQDPAASPPASSVGRPPRDRA
ncbi:CDP-alcohol phosphatidyltransferase family protein [bacterium]|nr:CDP-alcohol phosphatidyltransferase family protein [bacterium]